MKKYFAKCLPEAGSSKLFLCSEDIQMGDPYFMDIEHYPQDPFVCETKNWSSGFKVIGQVSPDAVWITEGMEFNDDEIKKGDQVNGSISPETIETYTYWGDRVKILQRGVKFSDDHLCEYLDDSSFNHNSECKKGKTFVYSEGVLGYSKTSYYKFKCPTCKTFH